MIASDLLARISTRTAPAVLDVRSRAEFAHEHVPGAIHAPFWTLLAGRVPVALSPENPVVVYCGHGPRAWLAGAALRRRGFRRVAYLDGHMSGWRRDGLREERLSR
jgi:rhodanese-related sulfurtransferase